VVLVLWCLVTIWRPVLNVGHKINRACSIVYRFSPIQCKMIRNIKCVFTFIACALYMCIVCKIVLVKIVLYSILLTKLSFNSVLFILFHGLFQTLVKKTIIWSLKITKLRSSFVMSSVIVNVFVSVPILSFLK